MDVLMSALPLVFTAPRRVAPPGHLADLAAAARPAAVAALGPPGYPADQLAGHYFTRFEHDRAAMTDLPAGVRAELGPALLPPLLTEVRTVQTDAGTTRK